MKILELGSDGVDTKKGRKRWCGGGTVMGWPLRKETQGGRCAMGEELGGGAALGFRLFSV